MEKYTLEFLKEKFIQHGKETKINNEKFIKDFEENNPGEPLPNYMTEDFNFPDALACICDEILRLKK